MVYNLPKLVAAGAARDIDTAPIGAGGSLHCSHRESNGETQARGR
jgi:hypothetical protein